MLVVVELSWYPAARQMLKPSPCIQSPRRAHIYARYNLKFLAIYFCEYNLLIISRSLRAVQTIDTPARISSKSAHLERLYIQGVGRTPFYLSVKYCALVPLFGGAHSVEDFISYVSLPIDHPGKHLTLLLY
jgi:hypothetical protein